MLLLHGESVVERTYEIILVQYCYIYIFITSCGHVLSIKSVFFLLHCIHFIVCVLTIIIGIILTRLFIHVQNVVHILVESLLEY